MIARAHRRATAWRRARCCWSGIALLLVGFGVQGRRGAVPHVGAGRLRGRADADHGVHGGDGEGGGVRGVPARLARGVPGSSYGSWHRARLVARRRDDGRRQRDRRCSSATSSACSRTRASRTPASSSSPRGGNARRARRRCCSICFAYTLATFGAFAVIIALGTAAMRPVTIDDSRRTLDGAPVARRRDDGLHARAARLPGLRRRRASSRSGTCCRRR